MNTRTIRADALLFITAAIWGLAFVAQRIGMEHVGPLTFNGVRFALGSLALVPLMYTMRGHPTEHKTTAPNLGMGGILLGIMLFAGSSLQQIGLAEPLLQSWGAQASTAGKAGFITGLYVVLVPMIGFFLGQRLGMGTWIGAVCAAVGMYLLSVTGEFHVAFGDILVLSSAFFWAGHVLLVGKLSKNMSAVQAVQLSSLQFAVCSILSLLGAFFTETTTSKDLLLAAVPILYGGLMSVGIAYTLQVVAQRDANPSHAAIILSLESVFAALGGFLILDEALGFRAVVGCGFLLAGMLIAQLKP